MAGLWTNIAATGRPPLDWKPWDGTGAFFGLTLEGVSMAAGFHDTGCDLLDGGPGLLDTSVLPYPSTLSQ